MQKMLLKAWMESRLPFPSNGFEVSNKKIFLKDFIIFVFKHNCRYFSNFFQMFSGSCVVPVFAWRCPLASPGRVVGAPVAASLTPMIGVTSVGTGATMPTTATATAREVAAAVAAAAAGETTIPGRSKRLGACWLFARAIFEILHQMRAEDALMCVFVSGPGLVHDLDPGPGPAGAATTLVLAAVAAATAGMSAQKHRGSRL